MRPVSAGVWVPDEPIVQVTRAIVNELAAAALLNGLGKARLLMHGDRAAGLHEMLIVHARGFYIQPHSNAVSSKSYHVVDGEMAVPFFDADGAIEEIVRLSAAGTAMPFFCRFDTPRFHTLIPISKTVAFIETILGPHEATPYAPWAPAPGTAEAESYHRGICAAL